MKASVVIPTYYRSYDLSRLLESLLKQLVKPVEVIVIDDTPTFEIKNMCEKYTVEFSRGGVALVYVKNHRERSIPIARNLGARMAHGDIVMFIDSDVTLYPDYVEKVLNVFKKYPRALGVGSWIRPIPRRQPLMGIRYFTHQTLLKLFYLQHDSRNSCSGRGIGYPIVLSRTIYCRWLLGASMSFRRSVFSEFRFDENLKGSAWGEDFLFSSSISERYHKSLLITPNAICIHNWSGEARPEGKDLFAMQMRNDKYVLTKLWGFKGLTMFGRKYLGLWFFGVIRRLKSKLGL